MRGVPRWLAVLCVVAFAGLVCTVSLRHVRASGSLRCELSPARIPADGFTTAEIKLHSSGNAIRDLKVAAENQHRIAVDSVVVHGDEATATLRAGVMPGTTELRITAAGLPEQKIEVTTVPDSTDSFGDGTPDFCGCMTLLTVLHFVAGSRCWPSHNTSEGRSCRAKLTTALPCCASAIARPCASTIQPGPAKWHCRRRLGPAK